MLKGGIIHSRERVEKMNHTRCDIENKCKSETATQKGREKCTKKISCPVEEEKREKVFKIVGCIQKDLAVQERMTKNRVKLYI